METERRDESSYLTLPFLLDEKQQNGTEVDASATTTTAGTTSFFKTCFNGLNALSGVGILSVPYAVSSGGWLSLILFLVLACAAFYTGFLIQRCMDFDSDIRSYPDIGERAFGSKGRTVLTILMCSELYLCAVGFLILEGDNLHNLFPGVFGFEMGGLSIGGKKCFVIMVALIIFPSLWLDNLSLLSYISASGVLASAIILGSVILTGALDDSIGFHQQGRLMNWSGFPTAVSLYAFCYCNHPVFPTLYTSMKDKSQFSNVLLVCFVLCTFGYASMAVFGYLMFGSGVESQITLNLPTGKMSSRVAIYTTLVTPIAKYALTVAPIVDAAKTCFPSHVNKRLFGLLFSTTLLISSVVIALALPFFADIMSLIGAFLSATTSIILPCLCYLKICGTSHRSGCNLLIAGGVIVLGVAIAIFGTYKSLVEIIGHLRM